MPGHEKSRVSPTARIGSIHRGMPSHGESMPSGRPRSRNASSAAVNAATGSAGSEMTCDGVHRRVGDVGEREQQPVDLHDLGAVDVRPALPLGLREPERDPLPRPSVHRPRRKSRR